MKLSDIKKYKEDYNASVILKKRDIVLWLLEVLKNRGQIFDDFYTYILNSPDDISAWDLDQVFTIILKTIYNDNQEKLTQAASRLQWVKDTIQKMKEQEKKESTKENLTNILSNQFYSI